MYDFLFNAGFVDQTDTPLGEVTDSAVEEAAGAAAGAKSEIVLFDQGGAQSAHGGIANDARAHDAAADDQEVQWLFEESGKRFGALLFQHLRLDWSISPNSRRPGRIKSGFGTEFSAWAAVASPVKTRTPSAP